MIKSGREVKTVNIQSNGNLSSTTGATINLSYNCIQGTAYNSRIGSKIQPVKLVLDTHVIATATSGTVRFVLVSDLQNNGTNVSTGDILDTTQYLSPYNGQDQIEGGRFKILFDFVMDSNVNGQQAVSAHHVHTGKMPFIEYNGTTAAAASNGKGCMVLLAIGSTATVTYDFTWRLDYTDA